MGELSAKFIKFWREKYPQVVCGVLGACVRACVLWACMLHQVHAQAGKSLQGSKDNYNSSDYVQLIGNRAQLPHRMRAM